MSTLTWIRSRSERSNMRASTAQSSGRLREVIGICGGYGFPYGSASGARISMVGRALVEGGVRFRLLHCGPSPVPINQQRRGIHEGMEFEYLTPVDRPSSALGRWFLYVWALIRVLARLLVMFPERGKIAIYLYLMDGILNFSIGTTCRALGFTLVQELCEWPPAEPSISKLTRWLYKGTIFKNATAFLAISREIEARVRHAGAFVNPDLLVHRLPVVADVRRWEAPAEPNPSCRAGRPEFAYCGTWLRDIFFLLKALKRVKDQGFDARLILICGSYDSEIMDEARRIGLDNADITLTGCVPHAVLPEVYRRATALMMPLWQDDRSITRLPNKMTEYLASGRPLVSSKIGDLMEFLEDGRTAFLAAPGSVESFAAKMIEIMRDPDRADQVGLRGNALAQRRLDFRVHAPKLVQFFRDCADWRAELRLRQNEQKLRRRAKLALRNAFCGGVAYCIIASGAVARARRRASRSGVISSIYFHAPDKKLFTRCLRWLRKHGYNFLSADDLAGAVLSESVSPPRAAWLSLDDGCRQILDHVIPVARQFDVPITVFIPSQIVEGNGQFPWIEHSRKDWGGLNQFVDARRSRDSITVDELRQIAMEPFVAIGSHTLTHAYTNELVGPGRWKEIAESKVRLEELTDQKVRLFAFPGERFNGREREDLRKAGYDAAVTGVNEFITADSDRFYLQRFSVPDNVWLSEAICRMTGVWHPVADRLKRLLKA